MTTAGPKSPPNAAVIAAGAAAAVVISFGSGLGTIGLFISYFASVPVIVTGTIAGVTAATGVAAAGAISLAILVAGIGAPLTAAIVHMLVYGAPGILIAWRARLHAEGPNGRDWYPGGCLFADLLLYSSLLVALGLWFITTTLGGLEQLLFQMLSDLGMLAALTEASQSDVDLLISNMARWFPGVALTSLLFLWIVNGAVGQLLLRRFVGSYDRPWMRLSIFRVPRWLAGLLALGALSVILSEGAAYTVGVAIVAGVGLGYFLQGLGIFHAWTAQAPGQRNVFSIAVYGVLFFFGVLVMPIFMIAGVLDQWMDLRGRITGQPATVSVWER